MTSFKTQEDAIAYPPVVLFQPSLEGYVNLFTIHSRQTPEFIASLPPATTWYERDVRKRGMVIAGASKVLPRFVNSLVIGFGSTSNTSEPGSILFVNAPYPVLEEDRLPTPPLAIGEGWCREPFVAKSVVNISGMSYGALSHAAVSALSRGAKAANIWMATGEGGLAPNHLEGGCDVRAWVLAGFPILIHVAVRLS